MTQTRRQFLRATLQASTLVSLAPLVPSLICRTALAAGSRHPGDDRTALVVIQLSGGNDGLNCVVPYADDTYARLRTTLRLTASQVHRIDDRVGFHPEMKECRRLFDEGLFSVVQGVGYPKSSRQHPDAERDWQTARPGDTHCPTGWIGRYADEASDRDPRLAPAAMVSTISKPFGLTSERTIIPAIRSLRDAAITPASHAAEHAEAIRLITGTAANDPNPMLDLVRASTATAHQVARRIETTSHAPNTTYPNSKLGAHLRDIATLVRADAGFRLFYTDLGGDGFGGFDNHAFQKDHHASLLRELSDAIGAFIDDLRRDGLAERVALMTVSEFGRTVTENGRHGTDHGAAAPVFLAGGALKGGLIGKHPELGDLDKDAPSHHTDFRQVYAAMLDTWLGCDSAHILGERFDPVDVFKA
ncbi:MAG TPA: DUF1501 domain-containing protein [Verrucomicrobiae bacterium]|nr:DUF1501 domain-containing protein [Verrucomicrobiae bacterium]